MDKCPCCESLRTKVFDPETNAKEFLCGSYLEHDNYFGRSTVCYEREIAALQEKVECLKDLHLEISALKERLRGFSNFCDLHQDFSDEECCHWCKLLQDKERIISLWGKDKTRLDAWRAWYIDPDQDRTRLQALNEL